VPIRSHSLEGKRAGMVCFSGYPEDPRPRRAIAALVEEGMSIDFICLSDGKSPARETVNGLNIRRLSIEHRRGGALAYAYQYTSFILVSAAILAWRTLRRRYDLVYIHNMPDFLVASAFIPKALGAKVILDQHDPMPELMTTIFGLRPESWAVRVIRFLEKWSLARANQVITVNLACKRIFGKRSCRPEKIGIVMNSPDDKIFGADPRPPRTRAASEERFVIMYHGSIVERNGLDLAVEALEIVRRRLPSVELRIYGRKTPFLERVLESAGQKGLIDQIKYLGPKSLEQLTVEIGNCSLGIIPNQQSDFAEINTPTRIFEYLALGTPVIAPRTMGVTDYFDDGSLLFFKAGSPDDLARQIEFVFTHPAEADDIVRKGQQVYREHCWQTERQRLIGLVEQLLGVKAMAAPELAPRHENAH
jgi:glycosyltransferase involved in cell wall biosynthesis